MCVDHLNAPKASEPHTPLCVYALLEREHTQWMCNVQLSIRHSHADFFSSFYAHPIR